MIYLQLFISFVKIGLFGFGGGAAMLSLIQHEIVEKYAWTTPAEFTNMIAVSQITPGPIGINCATYAGYLATGNILGAFIATLGLVLPSFVLILLVAKLILKYKKSPYVEGVMSGLRPAVVGLIGAACLLLINEETFGTNMNDLIAWSIFVLSFVLVKFFRMHPILLVVLSAGVGLIIY